MTWTGTPNLPIQSFILFTFLGMAGCLDHYPTSPLKAYDVTGHLGKSTTLRCQLRTGRHNRGWFRLTWARIKPDGTPLTVIHLPVRDKIPDWSKQIPDQLKDRIKPLITVQPGHVEFNIKIHNLTCEDESEYRCSAVTPQRELISVAELSVFATARSPKINMGYSPSQGHKHLNVNCKADVGLPPKTLVWYVKKPSDNYFTIIDRQRNLNEVSDGCHVVRTRAMTIHLSRTRPGTRYRCGFPGFITTKGMYDEIVLEAKHFPEVKLKPVTKKRKGDLKCQRGDCRMGRNTQNTGNHGTSPATTSIPRFLLLAVIISRLFPGS